MGRGQNNTQSHTSDWCELTGLTCETKRVSQTQQTDVSNRSKNRRKTVLRQKWQPGPTRCRRKMEMPLSQSMNHIHQSWLKEGKATSQVPAVTQAYLFEKRKEGTQHKCQKHNRTDEGRKRRSQCRQRAIKMVKQNKSSSRQHAAGQVESMRSAGIRFSRASCSPSCSETERCTEQQARRPRFVTTYSAHVMCCVSQFAP